MKFKKMIKVFWQWYQHAQRWYNKRAFYERFLFFTLCLILSSIAFGAVNFFTLEKKNIALDNDLAGLSKETTSLEANITSMQEKIIHLKNEQADFIKKNPGVVPSATSSVKINMKDYLTRVNQVEPIFKSLLDKVPGIVFEKIDHTVSQVDYQGKKLPLYQHTFHLSLKGDYLSIYNYLQELRLLEWRLFWNTLDYQVSDYPRATVQLEVFILSEQ